MKKSSVIFKKILILVSLSFSITTFLYSEDNTVKDYTSKSDEGLYFANAFLGKYNYFGALYQTKLYYKKALFRDKNSFFFSTSHLTYGIQAEVANFLKASVFVEFEPLIALKFLFRATYERALAENAKPVLIDKANGEYNQALPPFTGLNPKTIKPIYEGGNTFSFDISPTLTIGGPVKVGLLALIYNPTISYIHGFGIEKESYHYYGRDNIVVRDRDFYIIHDIKLGLSVPSLHSSFALITDIEQILSQKDIWRLGVFAGYIYTDSFGKNKNIIPVISVKLGTWLIDKYASYKPTFLLDASLVWKIK